ncbi:MAG: PQQ-dependent dehydrogenase, methanol/ethanol family [Myxococcota bacterium]
MRARLLPVALWGLAGLVLVQCAGAPDPDPAPADSIQERVRAATAGIDDARLRDADADHANWLTHGRTYAEQRFSPLDQITRENVAKLGLVWSYDLGSNRGVEATPIVVDGVIFATGPWSIVYAVDARTGREIWTYDPKVPRRLGERACCDVVNRGAAVYKGRVYAASLDGRLFALDAATGELAWEVMTVDPTRPYTITAAPRIVAGNVIIGNGGAEYGVRGYVTAYDAESGRQVWRLYTVPGDPSQPFESEALEMAAATWTGEWWKVGGGGTAWDHMAYDPELDLLYIGTGNGSPWSRYARSPGGGDNLFVSSILAVRPASGELVWYFQTTPGDNWDYTSTQHLMLADLVLDGTPRKVVMQAPKNGFFYVLDRETGEFLSAENFVEVTWATGIDADGRPIEAPDNDYREGLKEIKPSPFGAHNWHPMSIHPGRGLVYIPAMDIPHFFLFDEDWTYTPGAWNTWSDPRAVQEVPPELVAGALVAWDPVKQREAWRVPYPLPWNGGTLATAGDLVFQGTADGRLAAYGAGDGQLLWESPAGTGVVAAPVSYLVDGVQYVTVMAGWGGAFALVGGEAASSAGVRSVGRMLTFALGGSVPPPETLPLHAGPPVPALPNRAGPEVVKAGGDLFHRWCAVCHGIGAVSGGVLPDLRYSSPETHERFADIALGGIYQDRGMPSFASRLSPEELATIQAYVIARSHESAAN